MASLILKSMKKLLFTTWSVSPCHSVRQGGLQVSLDHLRLLDLNPISVIWGQKPKMEKLWNYFLKLAVS
jgi:hypothetical protein